MAYSPFQIILKSTSASLDAGLRPAKNASERSPDLLLVQGVISLLNKGDQLL